MIISQMEARWGHAAHSEYSSVFLFPLFAGLLSAVPLCSVHPLLPLCVPANSHSLPQTPPQFTLCSAFLSPYSSVSPSAPFLHHRWRKWINFETNKAAAVCTSSMIFCQKCSKGLCLDLCQDTLLCDLQLPWFLLRCLKTNCCVLCQNRCVFVSSLRGGIRANTGWSMCAIKRLTPSRCLWAQHISFTCSFMWLQTR